MRFVADAASIGFRRWQRRVRCGFAALDIRQQRWRRRGLWCAAMLALLLLVHPWLLPWLGHVLVVDEKLPTVVDAILIHSGDDRYQTAADWATSEYTGRILLTRPLPSRNVALGIVPSADVFARTRLLELDVSDEIIDCLEAPQFRGEWRDMRMLAVWLEKHPDSKTVVLCHRFDSRLTRYTLNRVLGENDARRVYVCGLPSRNYDERWWWRSRSGARSLFSSYISLSYAVLFGEDADEPITWNVDSYEEALRAR